MINSFYFPPVTIVSMNNKSTHTQRHHKTGGAHSVGFFGSSSFRGPLLLTWFNFNTLRPRENVRDFADDNFKCIFLNENYKIPIRISLKFVPGSPIDNIPALVRIMAWRRPGDKPLSELMMISFFTHVCVTRPQWVNTLGPRQNCRYFAGNIFRCIFLNENVSISINISLKFVANVCINTIPALFQIMA